MSDREKAIEPIEKQPFPDWQNGELRKYSCSLNGHATSFSLEPPFYNRLLQLAQRDQQPLARLIATIDAARPATINLSSALRLYVLHHYNDL